MVRSSGTEHKYSVRRSPSPLFAQPKCAVAKKSDGCLWMRGVRECQIDKVKIKLSRVPVVTVACGRS